jgi:hypothetical protein
MRTLPREARRRAVLASSERADDPSMLVKTAMRRRKIAIWPRAAIAVVEGSRFD